MTQRALDYVVDGVEEVDGTCVVEATLFPRTPVRSLGLEFEAVSKGAA